MTCTEASFWRGHLHGRRLAEHQPELDHERSLRWELELATRGDRLRRAWALGELRGYRQATDRP